MVEAIAVIVKVDFMRRWSASRQEFEDFIRGMGKEELQAMSQLFSGGLGLSSDEARAMADGLH